MPRSPNAGRFKKLRDKYQSVMRQQAKGNYNEHRLQAIRDAAEKPKDGK